MNKALKIIGLIVGIFFILLIAGCIAAAVSVRNDLDKSEQAGQNATASMSQIQLGMTLQQVEDILGPPESDQVMESDYETSTCIYYGTFSDSGSWQLCFTGEPATLDSKNRY